MSHEHLFGKLVKDIFPQSEVKAAVNSFMVDASITMGNDFSDQTLERVIEIVLNNFNSLPLVHVASAFKRGSLGHYGAGRLVPRTIYGWLTEVKTEYNRITTHENLQGIGEGIKFGELGRYPLGKAINTKIDWLTSGVITSEEWDVISLKEIAEKIGKGVRPTPDMFGIEY